MALEAYKELKKARNSSSSSRGSLQDPSRYSIDSDDAGSINELDPLHANGTKLENGNGSVAYPNGRRGSSPLPIFNRRGKLKDGRSQWRATLEGFLPIGKLDRWLHLDNLRGLLTTRTLRWIRRPMLPFGRSPGRILCFAATIFALLLLVITGSAGVYVVKKGTIDGMSPPWYPSPLGGTAKSWKDSYTKAETLVRRMTLPEKVNITTGTGWQMGMCVGNTGPAMHVKFPSLCLQDGPLGIRFADQITAGPAGVTVGATWDKNLMYKRGVMMGLEARRKGVNVLLGPSVGPLGRMPAGGRNWEGFGSDPVLQGLAAAETIKGIQSEGVMATIKHYVANEQEHYRQSFEWGLPNALSSNIDDRTLHELYVWPFADSVRAGVASVMCSYNMVNNSYACQNSKLINGILKDELGFQGFVQSDWLAQRSGVASALAGLDLSMPGDGRIWADGKPYWGRHLSMAVLNGSVPVERLNDMVTRIVAAWYQLGQDDKAKWPLPPPEGDGGPNFSSWTDEEQGLLHPGSNDKTTGIVNHMVPASRGKFSHRALARQIAAEGIVLLKNDDKILPLSRDGGSAKDVKESREQSETGVRRYRVAVFGEDAGSANDGGPNVCEDRGCNRGTLASGWGSGAVDFPYLIRPMDALRPEFHEGQVLLTGFPSNKPPSRQNTTEIEHQDLCLVFVNADSGEGFISDGGIRGDRPDLNIQKGGDKLIKDVAANCGTENVQNKVGKGKDSKYKKSPTIVIIHSVGPVILESFIKDPNVKAVILANLPGQESGNALVDVLFGGINPSGRLPYTIGKKMDDYGPGGQIMYYPNSLSVPQQDFSEGLMIDYRWFDSQNIEPRFEFGYGLSYTEFSLKDLRVTPVSKNGPDNLPSSRPPDQATPPTYGKQVPSASEALFPEDLRKLKKYIYPYISSKDLAKIERAQKEPAQQEASQHELSQAGGGEGGNPALWETMAHIEVTVTNKGDMNGQVVVQLYVKFPDNVFEEYDETAHRVQSGSGTKQSKRAPSQNREKITFPPRVLRGFDKIHTYASSKSPSGFFTFGGNDDSSSAERKVKFELTRRDLSYWSVRQQNWVLPKGQFEIQVGFSSRDIRERHTLF